MFRFASAARQAARASSRRAYSTAGPAPVKSDLPWAIASLAVFVPTVFYLTSPKEDAHAHGHHTANAKPAQLKTEAAASAHAVADKVHAADTPASEKEDEEEVAEVKETEKEETATDAPAAKKEKVDGPKDVSKVAEASQNTNDKEVEEKKDEEKEEDN